MEETLEKAIENLDLEKLNILQVSKILKDKYPLSMISKMMTEIRNKRRLFPPNTFGSCGINPEIDPCGDANEF